MSGGQRPSVPRVAVSDEGGARLFANVQEATRTLAEVRGSARTAAVRAVRALEAALRRALEGHALRGLKNLGHGSALFYAARVRAAVDSRLAWPVEADSCVEALCILPTGQLAIAQCRTDAHGACLDPTWRPATDDDLIAEDVEALTRTLAVVLPRHIAAAEQARERYDKLRALAARIEELASQ